VAPASVAEAGHARRWRAFGVEVRGRCLHRGIARGTCPALDPCHHCPARSIDTGIQDKTTGTDRERLHEIYSHAISPEAGVTFAIEQPADVAINEVVV
jgi:hypothetical protein